MKSPDALLVPYSGEQVTLISAALVAFMVIMVGGYYRRLTQRELNDVHDLHDLSATLASIPTLAEQLQLILTTYGRMHGATQGLLSLYDPQRDRLTVSASFGFAPHTLAQIQERRGGEGACGLACVERTRIVIEDIEVDPRFEKYRDFARHEGVRSVHATPLIGGDGTVIGALTVHFAEPRRPTARDMRIADICARKAAVFVARARAEDLANARDRRFRAVLEASGVPFVVLSPVRDATDCIVDFRWAFLNTAAAAVMRCQPEDFVGRTVSETVPRVWEDADRFRTYVEALETGTVRQIERQSEVDGNRSWFHIVASPLDGDLGVWFADITQRKRHERELVEADRRKDEFLATLAHELRNPLAPIRQAAAIARSESATDAQRRWSNNVIERQVQHMSLLLDDLLDVSRITHGTLQLRKQQTDLQSVLGAAIETARPLLDERHHDLRVEVPEGLCVNADPLRLAQVLANLLTNAAKYTNPRGTIRVRGELIAGELVITVADTGIGIAKEDLARVFGMFSQVRSTHDLAAGGLGIGLALAKGIVELHGGSIEAASRGAGKGATFTVRLPATGLSAPDVSAPRASREGQVRPGKRILLADDNRDAAESLAILLELEGHEVALAHDGEAALRVFEERRPDVALLDIGMPRANGYEVAREIRGRPAGADVTLIAITGWAQDADKVRSRAAGFDHHLSKPVEPEALIDLLDER